MRRHFKTVLLLLVLVGGAAIMWQTISTNASAAGTATSKASGATVTKGKLTFLELGSVGCKPCDAMVSVLDAVRNQYGTQVEVTFHDVRKNPDIAKQWHVVLIPTQVFLDREGKEYFRHEGYFALEDVVSALKKGGLQ